MHHAPGAGATELTLAQFGEHRLGRVPTVDDHRQIQGHRQIQLGSQSRPLFIEIRGPEQIQAQFTDRHHPVVGTGRCFEHRGGVAVPMLGIEGMDPYGVTQLRKAVGQGPDRRNLGGFHTGMDEGLDPRLPPSLRHLLEVRFKVAEHDVAMAVHQGWGSLGADGHGVALRRRRRQLPSARAPASPPR